MSVLGWIKRRREEHEAEESDDLERMVLEASELHGVPPKEVIHTVFDDDEDDEYYDERVEDEDDEAEEDEKPKRKVAMWTTFVLIGVIFGGSIVALMWLSRQSDKAGPVANSAIAQVAKSIQPTPAALPSLVGLNILFSYPQIFNNVETLPDWSTTAERYMIGSSADYRRTISVMVDNFPALTADSNYEYRSEDATDYTPENIKVEGLPAVVMVKHDGTEQTLFWAHASHVVIISVVCSDGTDNIGNFMSVIQKSLRWRPVSE